MLSWPNSNQALDGFHSRLLTVIWLSQQQQQAPARKGGRSEAEGTHVWDAAPEVPTVGLVCVTLVRKVREKKWVKGSSQERNLSCCELWQFNGKKTEKRENGSFEGDSVWNVCFHSENHCLTCSIFLEIHWAVCGSVRKERRLLVKLELTGDWSNCLSKQTNFLSPRASRKSHRTRFDQDILFAFTWFKGKAGKSQLTKILQKKMLYETVMETQIVSWTTCHCIDSELFDCPQWNQTELHQRMLSVFSCESLRREIFMTDVQRFSSFVPLWVNLRFNQNYDGTHVAF